MGSFRLVPQDNGGYGNQTNTHIYWPQDQSSQTPLIMSKIIE